MTTVWRLRNLAITLVCFFIASASVELLFPWPPLFALGLTVSTIGFILLGGLGQRYATIAFGALLIAIYTMLGVTLYDHWYLQPLFLLAGAVVQPADAVRAPDLSDSSIAGQLARSYEQLARYLELKSGCLILTLRMRAGRRCTIWRSLMASWYAAKPRSRC